MNSHTPETKTPPANADSPAPPGVVCSEFVRRFSVFIPRGRCGSAWPRWTVGIDFGNWGLGAIGESWGLRIMLVRIHVCYHSPNSKLKHAGQEGVDCK